MHVNRRGQIIISTAARLHREFDGRWELHLAVDGPDDLHVIPIDPAAYARLGRLADYLPGED
jgi:hypothetical protein